MYSASVEQANNTMNLPLNNNTKFKKDNNNSKYKQMGILNNNFEQKIEECINIEYNTSYNERVDKKMCDYLFSLNNDTLKDLVWDPVDNCNENGEKFNCNTYVKFVKKILNKFKANNYNLEIQYRQNDNVGRRFANEGAIQNLQNRLKSSLVENICFDYDMCNAHPTLILYIMKNYFKNLPCNYIKQYVYDKKNVLINNNLDKLDVLKTINISFKPKTDNLWLQSFHTEISHLQNVLYEKFKDKFTINSKTNAKGSLLNKILCVLENNILYTAEQHIFDKYNIRPDSLMFDGLHYQMSNLLNELNSSTKEFGIIWNIKKYTNPIIIDNSLISVGEIPYEETFDGVKVQFEKKYFMLMSPKLLFCRLFNDENGLENLCTYKSKCDFTTLVQTVKFKYLNNKGKIETDKFINHWFGCDNRKIYEKAVFKPHPMVCYDNEYNEFTGFSFEKWDKKKVNNNPDNYNIYQEHIKYLVGTDKQLELFNYIEQYIANILFNPGKLPKVSIIFRSKSKQIGKNLFFGKFFENCLYKSAVLDTTKPDQVFGKFGNTYKKFLVTLNESNIKSNYDLIENIKSAITDPYTNRELKGVDAQKVDNLARYIFFSNNLNCVKIEQGDKRFVSCNNIEDAKSRDYYNKLSDALDDKNRLLSYINYLKSIFDKHYDFANNRPITSYYNDLQSVTIPIIVDFWIYVINKNPEDSISMRAQCLYKLYNKWAKNHKLETISNQKFGRMIKGNDFLTKKRDKFGCNYIIDTYKLIDTFYDEKYIDTDSKDDILNNINNKCLIDCDEV